MFADYANIPVTTAFAAGINCLPSVRSTLVAAFPKIVWDGHEPRIDAVDLRSAAAFTVTLNFNTVMTAEITDRGDYQVKFCGTITQITFAAETTLTFFRVAWAQDRKNHNVPAFDVLSGTVITIKDVHGNAIPATDTANEFELGEGNYVVTATLENYETMTETVLYRLKDTVKLMQQPTEYLITFDVTPATASIEVKDSDNNVVVPTENPKVYSLPNSTVAGNYSYTVSAEGYANATGSLTVTADASETITLSPLLVSIEITTSPTTTAYTAGQTFDDSGMVVTATYTDEITDTVTGYTFSPDGALTVDDTEITVSYTENGVTKTAIQEITVTAE